MIRLACVVTWSFPPSFAATAQHSGCRDGHVFLHSTGLCAPDHNGAAILRVASDHSLRRLAATGQFVAVPSNANDRVDGGSVRQHESTPWNSPASPA